MKFEKGKKVRLKSKHYLNIIEGTILTIDEVSLCKSAFLCYDYPNEFIRFSDCEEIETKPQQYQMGIDTFERMEKNCTKEECLIFAKGNIDKYNWRNKGQDKQDLQKIINYAQWALKQLEK